MTIRKYIDAFMAKLGYVRAPETHTELETVLAELQADKCSRQLAATVSLDTKAGLFFDAAKRIIDAAEKRFAADPFASTFEVLPGEESIHIKLFPRAGSVQYLVNATGPQSAAFKFEAAVPRLVLVSAVVESPQ
jgi:hypothetical protein